jgi:outer membrane immunogenic protein
MGHPTVIINRRYPPRKPRCRRSIIFNVGGNARRLVLGDTLIGGRASLNWVDAKKSLPNALDDGAPYSGSANFKMDAFASVRGRMGLAYQNALVYVTGGPAWGHFNSSVTVGSVVATQDSWQPGIAAGAGVEFMVSSNLFLRGEFLALWFEDANNPYVGTNFQNTTCQTNGCGINFSNSAQIVRVGMDYKFGGLQ